MTNDLTKGSPLKQILCFSVPYLIGNLFQQFYNVADMLIVGRTLDPLAYAAVGATGSLVWFATGIIQGLTLGFSALTARFFGASDEEGVQKSFAASARLSFLISVILAALCVSFAYPMLELMQTPQDIIHRSYSYLVWIFAGLVATALFNLLSNMIRALGDSKTPLYFLVFACLMNIALDFLFILGFGMDTDGAGLATVLAQLFSGLLCIAYIKKKQPLLHFSFRHLKFDPAMDRALLHIGAPMSFLNMVLSIGCIVVQFVSNMLGTFYITAQATASKLINFATQPLISFASAVSVFTAQNYGAKQYLRVIEGSRKSVMAGFAWSGLLSLLMPFVGSFFLRLLAGDVEDAIIQKANQAVLINTFCSFFLTPLVVWKAVLQSVGRSVSATVSGFTEVAARAGLSVLVIVLIQKGIINEAFGFFLVCFCEPFAWLIGTLTFVYEYFSVEKMFRRMDAEEQAQQQNDALEAQKVKL